MWESLVHFVQRFRGDTVDALAIVVELLLIALSVNWCVSVLQGTRGTRPLKGVLLLLVVTTLAVSVLTVQLSWTRLELLYRYFLFGLAFVALIAFQPELRRAVIRAGDMRLRRRGAPQSRLIASLVKAAAILSRNRHGALIAIQRAVDLRGWAENGTLMSAEVSPNLLCTIFHPKTPLHDLGVIIKDSRILAASCQFPVADSDEIDAALGSRHLAAIGMSYETDALVLVVSEETGAIALADNGTIIRLQSPDELADALAERLGAGATERRERSFGSRLWRILRRLLLIVPLTGIIWYVADQATQISAPNIPVRIVVKSDPQVVAQVVDQPNPEFSVTLRGSTRAVDRLRAASAAAPLEVIWSAPNLPNRYPLQAEDIINDALRPQGVSVLNTVPQSITVVVDAVQTVKMRVRVNAGATRIDDERAEPDTVSVTMRTKDLADLPDARRVVDARIEERVRDAAPDTPLKFSRVALEKAVDRLGVVRIEPADVTVTCRVVGQRTKRQFPGIPVQLAVSPQVWKRFDVVLPDANELLMDLELEGQKSIIDGLRPQDIRATVPITADLFVGRPEFRSVEVITMLPAGVNLVGPPRTVRLRLDERPAPSE